VIGAGRIGLTLEGDPKRRKPATHAGTWIGNTATELVGLSDLNNALPRRAKSVAPDVPCFSDHRRMLAELRPDIVSIATHADTHVDIAMDALEAGARALVCEKPLSDNARDAARLTRAATEAGAILIVNHARRFDPMLGRLRDDLEAGLIGEIRKVSGSYVYGLHSTGSHLIDLIRFLTIPRLGDVAEVSGWDAGDGFHGPPGDPCIDGSMRFENGVLAAIQSLNIKDFDLFELSILGSEGRVEIRDRALRADIYPARGAETRSGFRDLSLASEETRRSEVETYFAAMGDHVVACLKGEATPASTGADSVAALRILDALRQSARTNGVRLAPKA
jgi:predicted dehydrogenase